MTTSSSTKAIAEVLRLGPSTPLRELGYKRAGRTFFAVHDGLYKSICLQADKYNTPESARFTFNLNVVIPFLDEMYRGRPFPKDTGSAVWVTSERVGFLLPVKRDHWWTIRSHSDYPTVAADLTTSLLNYGVPYLERSARIEGIKKLVFDDSASQIGSAWPGSQTYNEFRMILLVHFGDVRAANALFADELERSGDYPSAAFMQIAARLGLPQRRDDG